MVQNKLAFLDSFRSNTPLRDLARRALSQSESLNR